MLGRSNHRTSIQLWVIRPGWISCPGGRSQQKQHGGRRDRREAKGDSGVEDVEDIDRVRLKGKNLDQVTAI